MAIATGLTAARMLAIEAASVVSGAINGAGRLILAKHDGSTIDAGDAVATVPNASTTVSGKVELATDVETATGIDTTRAVTPAALGAGLGLVLPSRLKTTNNLGAGIDPDTLVDTGWYSGDSWAGSLAGYGICTLEVNKYSADWITQTATSVEASPKMFSRSRYGGTTWGPWLEISTKAYVNATITASSEAVKRGSMAQRLMMGGGIRKVNSVGISWSQRLIIMGLGQPSGGISGFYDVTMPPDGTVIPVYGSTIATTVTVASGKIPLDGSGWRALYYDMPASGTFTSDPARFKVMDYSLATTQEVPSSWILVARRNSDTLSAAYMWGDGRVQDFWKPLTLTNSWTVYSTSFLEPAWRFTTEGKVETRGLMKGGLLGLLNPFATLPYPELAPDGGTASGIITLAVASAGSYSARVDVLSDGRMSVLALGTLATNAYVSLDSLSWRPAGT